ncbi:hypothetical protein PoB_001356800 [Plakobranchus ocellatus]|uniref:Uncharacterized protein n=1 Tax=Plakobranchus ocellatus TaxID=259542 RepID=A0AAV3YWZ5_9GAST|nr:hypothetical protein PoB_001356800 [Plakobranchus ocellatus]
MSFAVTCNPALPNITSLLKTYFPVLHTSNRCKKTIPQMPMAAYRLPNSLGEALATATIQNNTIHGYTPFNTTRFITCDACTSTTSIFTSSVDNATYKIKSNLTCNSHNVIYFNTCTKCKIQCVGQTSQTLRTRLTIKNEKDTPASRHFNLPGHTLNHVHNRIHKETYWSYQLKK